MEFDIVLHPVTELGREARLLFDATVGNSSLLSALGLSSPWSTTRNGGCSYSDLQPCATNTSSSLHQVSEDVTHNALEHFVRRHRFLEAICEGERVLEASRLRSMATIAQDEASERFALGQSWVLLHEREGRKNILLELSYFLSFCEGNEPVWKNAAKEAEAARRIREYNSLMVTIAQKKGALEEDARQDKYMWFEEAKDWLTSLKYMAEDDKSEATRKYSLRIAAERNAAAAAAAISASQERLRQQQQPQPQPRTYAQPVYQQYTQPQSSAPLYGQPQYPPYPPQQAYQQPSQYPPTAYRATAPSQYYDPNRTNNYNVVNGVNPSNNLGCAQMNPSSGLANSSLNSYRHPGQQQFLPPPGMLGRR